MPSFDHPKRLRFVITLGTADFDSKGNNQITLEGFRATADVALAGGLQMGELRARIYGVKESDMNAITSFAYRFGEAELNTCVVYAIDGPTETLIFAGNIITAWPDFNSVPDVFLHIQAQAAFFNLIKGCPPLSFKGDIDVAIACEQLAAKMGYTLEGKDDVHVTLTDHYCGNTALEQLKEITRAAGIDFYIDGKVLAITPRNTPRNRAGDMPLINASTGLVGYPMFDGTYLTLSTLHNPAITPGASIKVESSRARASGVWQVLSMSHRLESEKPGGAWFTTVRCMADIRTITGKITP